MVSLEEVEVVNDIVKGRYWELNWKDANSKRDRTRTQMADTDLILEFNHFIFVIELMPLNVKTCHLFR